MKNVVKRFFYLKNTKTNLAMNWSIIFNEVENKIILTDYGKP